MKRKVHPTSRESKKNCSDPFPYDGPIERVDGVRPFNRFLWPTEQWSFYDEHPERYVDFSMRIEIVALVDGRFSTDGFTYNIEDGRRYGRERCVFQSRSDALRASAAGMIRQCRYTIRNGWKRMGVTPQTAPMIIGWARAVVARETGGPTPKPIGIRVPPLPVTRRKTGLPLFDAGMMP